MAGELTTSLGELRRRLGRLLGDMVTVTATDDETDGSFTDVVRLGTQIESPRHADIIFTSGSNAGLIRRITSADLNTGTITFETVATATLTGDTAEIHNMRAKGWPVPEKHDAINQAIAASWPSYKEPITVELTDAFDLASPVLAVPATMTHVSGVQYEQTDGDWIDLPSAYWTLDHFLGEITVQGASFRSVMDGLSVRLIGGKRPEPLVDDDDTTTVRPDYVVHQAASLLCQTRTNRGEQEFYNPMLINQQRADQFKPRSRGVGIAVRSA